jgi:hypothetical protein
MLALDGSVLKGRAECRQRSPARSLSCVGHPCHRPVTRHLPLGWRMYTKASVSRWEDAPPVRLPDLFNPRRRLPSTHWQNFDLSDRQCACRQSAVNLPSSHRLAARFLTVRDVRLRSAIFLPLKLIKIKSKACFELSNEFQDMGNLIYWSTISKHIFIYVADLSRAIHSIQMQKKGTEMGSTRKRKQSWCWAEK